MDAAELIDRPSDQIPQDQHPMCDESSMIATDALEAGVNQIIRLLNGRQTGLAIYAAPRTGKTHMIDYFVEHHPEFLETTIPCFKFRMWTPDEARRTTRASFYTDLLRLMGYPYTSKTNAVQKFGIVIDLMMNRVAQLKERRALLFADEAQRLRREEYGFLMDIFNELRDNGVRLKVVLVGQPELFHDRAELKKAQQIKARFMPRWFRMRGVTSQQDLERILKAVDDETEFPADSGWSYTYYFVPIAYQKGFRLSTYAQLLWTALDGARRECQNLSTNQDFTMQTVMEFLTDLLRELLYADCEDLAVDAAIAKRLAELAVQAQVDDEYTGTDRT